VNKPPPAQAARLERRGGGFNTARYADMVAKANEIKMLTDDEQLIIETNKHLQMLEELEKELHTDG
jgi:hypothetical protein